jgi:hypothetical protein
MYKIFLLAVIIIAYVCVSAKTTIINVPDDYTTIQEGIDASFDGDTVLVQPGTYVENINFNGHNILLGSLFLTTGDTPYISSTIIDGDSSGTVVIFDNEEDNTTVIMGFTIQNGIGFDGGGIVIINSFPIIKYNMIYANYGYYGGGISCYVPELVVGPHITNNIIIENSADFSGGGIYCTCSNNIKITNNIIIRNEANSFLELGGGGICLDNFCSNVIITNNMIFRNSCIYGAGINYYRSNAIIKNTILWSNYGPEIEGEEGWIIVNYCDIQHGFEGEGNINIDPLFRNSDNGDFHLMATYCGDPYDSPCIDMGHPDIIDSLLDCDWGLGELRSDMGAYGGGDSVQVVIDDQKPQVPGQFALIQNYPNPFNPTTTITFSLLEPQFVTLNVYDLLGREVQTLVNENKPAGIHTVDFDASELTSGIYFYHLQAGDFSKTNKMILLK